MGINMAKMQDMKDAQRRVVVWFSAGAASAIALKLAKQKYGHRVVAVYCDTGSEHPDNMRFLRDVENWCDIEIKILKNEKYQDHFDVIQKRKYVGGLMQAPCTLQLKKRPRQSFENLDDIQIFGYTLEERQRAERFDNNNPELTTEWILIDKQVSKHDCLGLIWRAGIKIPAMYDLGYNHNNCVGCVKGGKGYWNKIRNDFPEAFERMSVLEREIGYTILRTNDGEPLYLDELDPSEGNHATEPAIECGLGCGIIHNEITKSV